MKTQEELTSVIAQNITTYRKKCGLTQLQLAEKISYSDKAISKWERGEAIPDVFVLFQLANIFNISINELLDEESVEKKEEQKNIKRKFSIKNMTIKNRNRMIISLLSYILAWFVFTIAYVLLEMSPLNLTNFKTWLLFIYAIPVSSIVLLVFAKMWGLRWMRCIIVSFINWGISLSLCLSIEVLTTIPNSYLLYLISASFQVLIMFWYLRKK